MSWQPDYYTSTDHNRGSAGGITAGTVSFLFVVNRLNLTLTPPLGDEWGNVIPPKVSEGFTDEEPSVVMRYKDGRVTEAWGYSWHREGGWGAAGRIVSNYAGSPTPRYREQTVFSCNPHLPIIVGNFDATVQASDLENDARKWNFLHFMSRLEFPAVSFANGDAEGRAYVVGSKPSWMPSLVPQTFQDKLQSRSRQPSSLGGDVPLVLGLMAFWDDWEENHHIRMQNTFYGQNSHWSEGEWRAPGEPRGYPTIEETPRGFLVHVSLDDENPYYSTREALANFERERPIVPDVPEHYSYYQ